MHNVMDVDRDGPVQQTTYVRFQWWFQEHLCLLAFLFLALVAPLRGMAVSLFSTTPCRGGKQGL